MQRAAIALSEKGVAFERITIDLAAKPEWFKAVSPLGKVPLLRVARPGRGDAVLFESAVICEFIEETQAGAPCILAIQSSAPSTGHGSSSRPLF